MKSVFGLYSIVGILSLSFVATSCDPFERATAQDASFMGLAQGDSAISELLGSSGHIRNDRLVLIVADHQLVFHSSCALVESQPSVVLLDVTARNPAIVQKEKLWERYKAGASLFCEMALGHGVKRFYSDLSVDSSLVFVFDEEKKRMQYFMGKRPNRFPHDINLLRKRLAENWDLLLSGS